MSQKEKTNKKEKRNVTPKDSSIKTRIELEYPINFNGEKITFIKLRRARYRDVKKVKQLTPVEALDVLMVDLSEHPVEMFDEIDPLDIKEIEEVIMSFLGWGNSEE